MNPPTEIERAYIQAARSLGSLLRAYALNRREEDRKMIAAIHHEVAQIHRAEERLLQQKASAP